MSYRERRVSLALTNLSWLSVMIGTPLILTNIVVLPEGRLTAAAWNFGHLPYFFALSWILLGKFGTAYTLISRLILANILAILVSISIEAAQYSIGRDFSTGDIFRNCVGVSLAVVFYPRREAKPGRMLGWLRAGCLVLLAAALSPLIGDTIDTLKSRQSFPLLADFESRLEISRWRGNNLEIRPDDSGRNHVLANTFSTEEFSPLTLAHFPPDWSDYDCLGFTVVNRRSDPVALELKIHDRDHVISHFEYSDRYNEELEIRPGINHIVVDLDRIRYAPARRDMDMKNIRSLSLFTNNAAHSQELLFDDFRLFTSPNCNHSARDGLVQ